MRNTKWMERVLVLAQAAFVIGIAWAFHHSFMVPAEIWLPDVKLSHRETVQVEAKPVRPLESYAPIWARNWHQPPVDPPVAKQEEPKPTLPVPEPVSIGLLATAIEPQNRYGVFLDSKKRIQVLREKDVIDAFTITAIESDRAELVGKGRTVWVEIPKKPSPAQITGTVEARKN